MKKRICLLCVMLLFASLMSFSVFAETSSDTDVKNKIAELEAKLADVKADAQKIKEELSRGHNNTTSSENIIASGTCGDNLTWTLDENGTLTISGTGELDLSKEEVQHVKEDINRVVIENGVLSVRGDFDSCTNLKSIEIPESVKYINDLWKLKTIYVDPNNKFYSSDEHGVLFDKDKRLLIYPCYNDSEIYNIPDGVTSIGDSRERNDSAEFPMYMYTKFLRCDNLVCVTIPSSVKSIEYTSFAACKNLTTVIISEGLESIKGLAFADCKNLRSIVIPNSVKNIDNGVFHKSNNITIYGYDNSTAQQYANDNNIPFVAIDGQKQPNSGTLSDTIKWEFSDGTLEIIGTGNMPDFEAGKTPWFSFANQIKTVLIDERITSIGTYAFFGCNELSGIIIPKRVTTIGKGAFSGCTKLGYVTLYPGIFEIGARAFEGCKVLSKINLPDTIIYIGDYAFSGCSAIERIVVPVGVTELRPYVFSECTKLLVVIVHSGVVVIDENAFSGINCALHGYTNSYVEEFAKAKGHSFIALGYRWSVNSGWGTKELERADELKLVPEVFKERDLSASITRVEFASVAVKVYESITGTETAVPTSNPFTDTNDVDVLKAYSLGITTGVSETEFAPNSLLTREQAATMLTRVYKKVKFDSWTIQKDGEYKLDYEKQTLFADDDKISDWAKDSVYFMSANGIINGVGNNNFAPKNTTTEQEAQGYANATREQAIIISLRMFEMAK